MHLNATELVSRGSIQAMARFFFFRIISSMWTINDRSETERESASRKIESEKESRKERDRDRKREEGEKEQKSEVELKFHIFNVAIQEGPASGDDLGFGGDRVAERRRYYIAACVLTCWWKILRNFARRGSKAGQVCKPALAV